MYSLLCCSFACIGDQPLIKLIRSLGGWKLANIAPVTSFSLSQLAGYHAIIAGMPDAENFNPFFFF